MLPIAVDAMGGDHAPSVVVDGAVAAAFGRTIDLFRRLGGRHGGRPGADLDGHFERIAVGHPARGGQQDRQGWFPRLGLREQNPAGIALIEIAEPGPAVPQVEGDTAFAGGAQRPGAQGASTSHSDLRRPCVA